MDFAAIRGEKVGAAAANLPTGNQPVGQEFKLAANEKTGEVNKRLKLDSSSCKSLFSLDFYLNIFKKDPDKRGTISLNKREIRPVEWPRC